MLEGEEGKVGRDALEAESVVAPAGPSCGSEGRGGDQSEALVFGGVAGRFALRIGGLGKGRRKKATWGFIMLCLLWAPCVIDYKEP